MKSVRMTNLRNLFGVGVLNRWQRALAVVLVCAATTTTVPAQVVVTFKNLANFDLTNGEEPNGLAQGVDGNFYGTTDLGGANSCNCGVIFKITPGGNLSALHSFTGAGEGADGGYPGAGLTLGPDGNFYGTTSSGGPNEGGTVFQFNPSTKAVTVLWSFPNANGDGEYPEGALALGSDGNFYGTTSGGGKYGSGMVFKITLGGDLTPLYSFCKETYPCMATGMEPEAGLMQLAGGPFYGTTYSGGEHMSGTIFVISSTGTFTKLYDFESAPSSGLVQGSKGELYGTSGYGGSDAEGWIYEIGYLGGTPGTVCNFGPDPQLCTDGENPTGQLLLGTEGNLYGTTYYGGTGDDGAIYLINPTGVGFTALHNFAGTDGLNPASGMIEATSGILYGTTTGGGTSTACSGQACGTVFSLTSNALHRFVKTVPIAGPVGTNVIILGNGLTGATSVTFNGTAATSFTVVSSAEITTTVPTGATTGKVKVVTSAGKTLTSNVAFAVTQ